jgi:hypothetical protein
MGTIKKSINPLIVEKGPIGIAQMNIKQRSCPSHRRRRKDQPLGVAAIGLESFSMNFDDSFRRAVIGEKLLLRCRSV